MMECLCSKNSIDNRESSVENQVCVGIKVLCVTTGPIIFKESFCFFPFSLATFP